MIKNKNLTTLMMGEYKGDFGGDKFYWDNMTSFTHSLFEIRIPVPILHPVEPKDFEQWQVVADTFFLENKKVRQWLISILEVAIKKMKEEEPLVEKKSAFA